MTPAPVKPGSGPTLPELVRPRWRALSANGRRVVGALAVALAVVAALGLLLYPWHRSYSHSGRVSFSLNWARSLHRVAPDPGGYLKVEQTRHGRLVQSLAVDPIRLAAYRGDPDGELPIYAYGYVARLARQHPGFRLLSEGKTRVNTFPGYSILYQATLHGRTLWGRDDLLVPDRPGYRDGVTMIMLATRASGLGGPSSVGATGPVSDALRSLNLG